MTRRRSAVAGYVLVGALGLGILTLGGCGDNQTRNFGTVRDAPSDTRVRSLPPLNMPPTLAQRPGRAGVVTANELTEGENAELNGSEPVAAGPSGSARSARRRAAAGPSSGESRGEQSLLAASGPAAPANIRDRVEQDAMRDPANEALTDQILFGTRSAADNQIIERSQPKSFWSRIF